MPVADGFDHPLFLCSAPGDRRLFVVEQPGRIRWIEGGKPSAALFADLASLVKYGGERGLLGLAFSPDYATNGYLFVDYTDLRGDTQIARYTVRADRQAVDPGSAKSILSVKQPFPNHNGGMVAFGPDGMLYVGMGDGGAGGDPFGNAQNPHSLLGKMLRLDVDHGTPYTIPDGNPYKSRPGDGKPEIWATGLRNPWRYAFDFTARLLFIADVGQNKYEEVDVVDARRAGANYGWNVREGLHGFGFPRFGPAGRVEPVIEYGHADGCSVTGGYAYRGKAMPQLAGVYFFSDYCNGWLRSFRWDGAHATDLRQWSVGNLGSVTSFGEDAEHELYVVAHEGRIWKLTGAGAAR
ncbi:MAG TPA: PQQ-dependent sugar dehydrogenase [Candidatus Eisenbacteria bacterium]